MTNETEFDTLIQMLRTDIDVVLHFHHEDKDAYPSISNTALETVKAARQVLMATAARILNARENS